MRVRLFDRDKDGVGTRVGLNPWHFGNTLGTKILLGTVKRLDADRNSLLDMDNGRVGSNYAYEYNYLVFENEDDANNLRAFDSTKDEIGARVAVTGINLPDSNDSTRLYTGTIREIKGSEISDGYVGIEFDENIGGHSLDGKIQSGHGWNVGKRDVFILSEGFVLDGPKGSGAGIGGVIKSLISELLISNLSKTNSNRVNVVIEDLKAKVGEDWEAEVRKSIEPEEAAEIFIGLIKQLEKQEQERIQFGSVQKSSIPTTKQPKPATSGKRGRPRKEKTPEPKPMPTTPQVSDVQTEEDLSALLDDLLNL